MEDMTDVEVSPDSMAQEVGEVAEEIGEIAEEGEAIIAALLYKNGRSFDSPDFRDLNSILYWQKICLVLPGQRLRESSSRRNCSTPIYKIPLSSRQGFK